MPKLKRACTINAMKVKIMVNERYSITMFITGERYVYEVPRSAVKRFFTNEMYCSNSDLSRLNDLLICSANCGLKSGDRNFCAGFPGAILIKKKTNVITRNNTITEERILLNIAPVMNLFI
jgi:hypothetical protein